MEIFLQYNKTVLVILHLKLKGSELLSKIQQLLNAECQHVFKKPGSCVHPVSSLLETVSEDTFILLFVLLFQLCSVYRKWI